MLLNITNNFQTVFPVFTQEHIEQLTEGFDEKDLKLVALINNEDLEWSREVFTEIVKNNWISKKEIQTYRDIIRPKKNEVYFMFAHFPQKSKWIRINNQISAIAVYDSSDNYNKPQEI